MSWKKSDMLMDTIRHYSGFPATGVSLRQMVQFGERPSTGMWDYDLMMQAFHRN
jgi:pyruvate dehydrogenase kinase 2/3/4